MLGSPLLKKTVSLVFAVAALAGILMGAAHGKAHYDSGWRAHNVITASMGEVAPVGTTLITRPLGKGEVEVGDFIVFQPKGIESTYAHRVVEINELGIMTQGDVNGASDPWYLTKKEIIGEVVHTWWPLGWIVKFLPWLLLGSIITWAAASLWRSDQQKKSVHLIGHSASFLVASLLIHPWIGMAVLSSNVSEAGVATAEVVGTGILPARVQADGGTSTVVYPGEVGKISTTKVTGKQEWNASPGLYLPREGWMILAILCGLPLAYGFFIRGEPDRPSSE